MRGHAALGVPGAGQSRRAWTANVRQRRKLGGVPGESLSETYAAIGASVPLARHALIGFAAGVGAGGELLDGIGLAVSEALTNVVKHAYEGDPGRIHVAAAVASDELWVLIADDGRGVHPHVNRPDLGLGLTLIAIACEELTIVKRASGGTELRMRFDLGASEASAGAQAQASVPSRLPASVTARKSRTRLSATRSRT